ncbi:MbcA/ParS/Xre antitoxin family protein [Maritimibacter harenae]|uniref:MbcA/ParS/Xre antitoxin family protein n=1 Tax=Maritimibacter harenae TaxID=2606218 RepID=UPI001F41B845|nr:MbcA/ParS/Xre antitoxin family protein [Maritimibacter harenae]
MPKLTQEESCAMVGAVVRLFDRWSVADTEALVLLGDLPAQTWSEWKAGTVHSVARDVEARLAHLLAIHRALRTIFTDVQRGYRWVRQPNTAFGGRSALDVMRQGNVDDIVRVRRYLEGVVGA